MRWEGIEGESEARNSDKEAAKQDMGSFWIAYQIIFFLSTNMLHELRLFTRIMLYQLCYQMTTWGAEPLVFLFSHKNLHLQLKFFTSERPNTLLSG